MASGYGRYITKDAMYTGDFGNGNMNGKGTYETFGKGVKKMTGKWINNVLKESDDKASIGFKITMPKPPKVGIDLSPMVKSLSENMVKAPKLPDLSPKKKQEFKQLVSTWQKSKPLNINALE